MNRYAIAAMVLIVSAATMAPAADQPIFPKTEEEAKVPLVRILANPEKFENHWVKTGGYLVMEFEHCALYLSKEDREHALTMNGVWIRFDAPIENVRSMSEKWVVLEGVFTANDRGHLGLWQGAIRVASARVSDWVSESPEPSKEAEPNKRVESNAVDAPRNSGGATAN